ncbi:MAG: hypothetical protein IPP72_20730 [Chitinophagaceae bacterium]|nr:hypothetical protein [Chitinophagaceae bacterium]
MKRHFLQVALFAFVTLFALSCKKSSTSNNGTYFVKIKKNGTWISFATTAGELGPDGFNAAYTDFGVSAITTSGTERFDLTVQINGTNFATGTYHSSTIVSHPLYQHQLYLPAQCHRHA